MEEIASKLVVGVTRYTLVVLMTLLRLVEVMTGFLAKMVMIFLRVMQVAIV